MVITSLDNKEVKYLVKLNTKKFRDSEHKFLIDGEHLVEEAYKKGILDKIIVVDDNYSFNCDKLIVTKEIMKKISLLDTPPNIMGVCKMMDEKLVGNKYLILDRIQDPGNLGTIIRSAVAFNVDTIIMSNDTVDLYNSKVLRATQGMIFSINYYKGDLVKIINDLKDKKIPIYTTNVNNGKNIKEIDDASCYALIMGNEGSGVRDEIANLADTNIYIPMSNSCESLNVAVATSILLYEMSGK